MCFNKNLCSQVLIIGSNYTKVFGHHSLLFASDNCGNYELSSFLKLQACVLIRLWASFSHNYVSKVNFIGKCYVYTFVYTQHFPILFSKQNIQSNQIFRNFNTKKLVFFSLFDLYYRNYATLNSSTSAKKFNCMEKLQIQYRMSY